MTAKSRLPFQFIDEFLFGYNSITVFVKDSKIGVSQSKIIFYVKMGLGDGYCRHKFWEGMSETDFVTKTDFVANMVDLLSFVSQCLTYRMLFAT